MCNKMATNQGNTYNEDTIEEFGVSHIWYNTEVIDSIITKRGTLIEMIKRPGWGIACYMNNSIQSCEVDEKIYHEALVHPVMSSVENPKRVMIIGGGEGATAREVLKWNEVEKVDMYEWDEDVVKVFKEKYPQWAKNAWYDNKLTIHYHNIFDTICKPPCKKYDVIIIDLFDPDEDNKGLWKILIKNIGNWCNFDGSIVMYSGMRNILQKQTSYKYIVNIIEEMTEEWRTIPVQSMYQDKDITPYRVFIPSFSGESTFILFKKKGTTVNFKDSNYLQSHITNEIWNSYKLMNW